MEYKQITIMEVIASLEGNGARPSHKGSGIGDKDISFTLNATEQHGVALSEVHAPLSAMDGEKCNHSQKLKNPQENFVLEAIEDQGAKVFGIGSKDSNAMKSANPHSGIYEADTARTLDLNGGNPGCNQGGMAICIGNGQLHDAERPEEVCKTLNCMADPMKIVETVDVRITSEGTKNARAHAYETEIARSLSTAGDDPDSNHGGVAVCYQGVSGTLAASDYKFPQQQQVEEGKCVVEVSQAIKEINETAPHQQDLLNDSEGIARTLAVGCHGSAKHLTKTVVKETKGFENNSFGSYRECETSATLKANGGDFQGGETVVKNDYAVRRLTPVECERLQGMPDMWCYGIEIEELDDKELNFWLEAFETFRKVISGATKPKTEKQVRKAVGKELTDSAVYKIQGNGIALPNAWFVLEGVAKTARGEL